MLLTILSNQGPAPAQNYFWVKVNGVWKVATSWIKISGVWKQMSPKLKVAGVWK
jgi:hypothetical protein